MNSSWDDQYVQHVGYGHSSNRNVQTLFSESTLTFIANKVSELLKPFYPSGIIVPLHIVANVLNKLYRSFIPPAGDGMTRYLNPSDETDNYVDALINQAIQVLCTAIKDDLGTQQTNSKLTKWTTVLGDFNKEGLRAHQTIKIREKRPQTMMFISNY